MSTQFDPTNYDTAAILVVFTRATGADTLTEITSAAGNSMLRGQVAWAQGIIEDGMDTSESFKGLPCNIIQNDRGLTVKQYEGLMKKIDTYFSKAGNYPFVGVVFGFDGVNDLPGNDGKITIFLENPTVLGVVQAAPYQSAKVKRVLRSLAQQQEELENIQRQHGNSLAQKVRSFFS